MNLPKVICDLALDAHLLARYASPEGQRPDGRAWERAVSGLLFRPGLGRRQHAGTLGLFGAGSASSAAHEIDGAGAGADIATWIEAKARGRLEKADVAVFDLKCFDLYRGACIEDPSTVLDASWWPLLVSSEPISDSVRRVCIDLGIVLCDPQRLPLAIILRAAGKPAADSHIAQDLLSEFVRLAEPVVRPMQRRWRLDAAAAELRTPLACLPPREVGDLLFLQDELSGELYDLFDVYCPGWLARRAVLLADRMTAAALSV